MLFTIAGVGVVRETRDDKLIEISTDDKRAKQRERLTPDEAATLYRLRDESLARQGPAEKRRSEPSLDYATEHVFERVSVARDFDVLTVALRHGRGRIDTQELKGAMGPREAADKIIRQGVNIASRNPHSTLRLSLCVNSLASSARIT